jgi:hypothetical protein
MSLADVLGISDYIYVERASDISSTVTGTVINDVNIRRPDAGLENARQRLGYAHGLILCRKQHAKLFHS